MVKKMIEEQKKQMSGSCSDFIGSIGAERLAKYFVVQFCAVFETVANGTLPIINIKLYSIKIPTCFSDFKQSKPHKIYFGCKRADLHFFFIFAHEKCGRYLALVYIIIYTKCIRRCIIMMTAKLFENGRSQAVRLPKECRFNGDEVAVNKIGDIVILMPKENKWAGFLNSLEMFSDDFMSDGREQLPVQEREAL